MIYTIAHKRLDIWCNSIKMLILLLHKAHRNSWYKAKGIHPLYKNKSNTIWFNNQNDLILVWQETIFTMQTNYDMNKT